MLLVILPLMIWVRGINKYMCDVSFISSAFSYLTVPVNCLLNTDFTNVCTADESSVRKLADKWKQNFHDDVCTDDQEQVPL